MRHPRLLGTAIGCLALLGAGTVPANADPANTFTLNDAVATIADDTNDLVAFVNTTREQYCSAEQVAAENAFLEWLLGGEEGDPPEFPVPVAATPLDATEKAVGTGNFRFAFRGSVPVELWTFEAGKSTAADNLVAPCIDTDGILDLNSTFLTGGELFAAGEGTWAVKDNDAFGTGPRSNVWGDRITASLSGPGGDYGYSIVFTNHVVRGEYTGTATFRLRSR